MSLQGGFQLRAALDSLGRTVLREQSFCAPIHISKPHHESGWLVVNLASPTPGLLEGDRVSCRAVVESGARLLLTAPSASRIHSMGNGRAEWDQEFIVAAGGCLDVLPEYLIPQVNSRYHQRSILHVEPGGTLLWTESIAPGRVAMGEVFAFNEVHLSTDASWAKGGKLRERYQLRKNHPSTQAQQRIFETPYYASILCIGPEIPAESAFLQELQELHDAASAWVGCSSLGHGAIAVKILAADSPALRRTMTHIRGILYRMLGMTQPLVRRVTGEIAAGII